LSLIRYRHIEKSDIQSADTTPIPIYRYREYFRYIDPPLIVMQQRTAEQRTSVIVKCCRRRTIKPTAESSQTAPTSGAPLESEYTLSY